MTSLAKQLQKLAIPGQPSLHQVVSKKRPSLLFDPKDAADIDAESIHSIGLNGLEELISIDQSFEQFESTLFQDSCKDFERTVQTKEVLEDVDSKITTFLRKVSPYFLLKPAQKCLEWLIRSFRINSFNVDALMECVLPYHETNLFARVLQLLSMKDSSSPWHWLSPAKKAGSPLSKLALVQHCVSEPSFLAFLCEAVTKSIKTLRSSSSQTNLPLLCLYTSTVVAVLEEKPVTEELVSRLLPYLVNGLKSSNADYRAGSYMVVSQLAAKSTLDSSLCNSMLEVIAKHLSPELVTEGLCCIAVFCHTQQLKSFTKKTLKHLCSCQSLTKVLTQLSQSYYTTPLLSPLLTSLVMTHLEGLHANHDTIYLTTIISILDAIHLENDTVRSLLQVLFESYLEVRGQLDLSELIRSLMAPLVQSLDAKYPTLMDGAIETAMGGVVGRSGPTYPEAVRLLQELLTTSLPHSRHQVLTDLDSTLALSVAHSNPALRVAAVQEMGKSITAGSSNSMDHEFVSSSLLARLRDDDHTVVAAVLSIDTEALFCTLPAPQLVSCLLTLLRQKRLHKSHSSHQHNALSALQALLSHSLIDHAPNLVDDVITTVIPLLFTGRHSNILAGKVGKVIAESVLSNRHPVLRSLTKVFEEEVWQAAVVDNAKDPTVLATACEAVFDSIGRQLVTMDTAHNLMSQLLSTLASTGPDQSAYFSVLGVLGSAVCHMSQDNITTQLHLVCFLLEHIKDQLFYFHELSTDSSDVVGLTTALQPLMWKHPNKNRGHGNVLLWVMNIITEHLLIPDDLSTAMWLEPPTQSPSVEQLYYHVLLVLFSLLADCVEGVASTVTRPMLHGLNKIVIEYKAVRSPSLQGIRRFAPHASQSVTSNYYKHFGQAGTLMRFLAMIWTTPISGTDHSHQQSHSHSTTSVRFTFQESSHSVQFKVTPTLQAQALAVAAAYLSSLDTAAAVPLLGTLCPIVPSLLYPLMSPIKALRHSAISCLLTLLNATQTTIPSEAHPFLHLVNLLCESQLELTADPNSLIELFRQLSLKTSPTRSRRGQSRKSVKMPEKGAGLLCVEGVLGHVVMFGMPRHVQVTLLRALAGVEHQVKLAACTSLLKALLNSNGTSTPYDGDLIQLAVSAYTSRVGVALEPAGEAWQLLLSLLAAKPPVREIDTQAMAVKQITPEFYSSLTDPALKQNLLSTLINALLTCKEANTSTLLRQHLVKLPLTAEMVRIELVLHSDELGGAKPPPTPIKRTRRSKASSSKTAPPDNPDIVSLPWKRVTVILELLQQCSVDQPHLLVPELFNLLNRCLSRDTEQRQVLEYTQQLVLSTLLELCTILTKEGGLETTRELLQEGQFNVELVVQCVRLSLNPQTHQQALLLLSTAASIFPGPVLHNIMPIFTFMGSTVFHHDDQYSFSVITRTIDSVMPALLQSGPGLLSSTTPSRRKSALPPTTVVGVVKEVLQVFVDSLPHVPDHRRLPLLTHLLRGVGPAEQLHTTLALLMEKQVAADELSVEMDPSFPILLTQQFSPTVQLSAMHHLIQYITKLPQEKPKTASKLRQLPAASTALFNIAAHSDKQLRQFRSSSLSLLISLLSEKDFVVKLSAGSEAPLVEEVVLKLLQTALGYSLNLNKVKSSTPAQETKYWQNIINKTYSITEKVISLLSPQAFLDIISQLLTDKLVATGDIQRKALDIFNNRLEEGKMRFTTEHDATMLELLGVLVGVASSDQAPPITRQTALYGVKLLIRRLASRHHQHIVKYTRSVLSLVSETTQSEVLSSCLLALGESCSALGPQAIPLLPSLLPPLLVSLSQDCSGLLQLSAATALGVIVRTLPRFISSFISDIITKLCQPSLTSGDHVELANEAASVRNNVAGSVPSRVLLPAYLKCYPDVLHHGKPESVVALLSMLSVTIEHMDKDEVKGHNNLLLNVFTPLLDYRATQDGLLPLVAIETVEKECISSFSSLVIKLSESLFRPLFIQLLDWASQTSAPSERLITFYHLADSVAGKLKNLFLLFAGHILKNTTSLLTTIHEDNEEPLFQLSDDEMTDIESVVPSTKSCQLLNHLLHCLTKCFSYDKGGDFLTRERFDALMQPLIDQVSNMLGGMEVYSQRVESSLVPCLTHFAVAAGKDSLWKPLNYQLLLKTKHPKLEVRLSALKVLQAIYLSLGEEFMTLLPETIPFLAECLEDESEEVEQLAQKVVATIEQILGEPIQQYF